MHWHCLALGTARHFVRAAGATAAHVHARALRCPLIRPLIHTGKLKRMGAPEPLVLVLRYHQTPQTQLPPWALVVLGLFEHGMEAS